VADLGTQRWVRELADTLQQIQVERSSIEAKVQQAVADWRGLLTGSVADGRQLLREVLAAPLQFTPEGKTYAFTAPTTTGSLIAGSVLPTWVASPTGTSDNWNVSLDAITPSRAA
jgi:hypothetical protein